LLVSHLIDRGELSTQERSQILDLLRGDETRQAAKRPKK
jgi:hypothetical protein